MIKQSKKRLVAFIILLTFVIACAVSVLTVFGKEQEEDDKETSTSDVVESKSVIDEQIVSQTATAGVVSMVAEGLTVEENVVVPTQAKEYFNGWVTTQVNLRAYPDMNAPILTTYNFNTQITYAEYDNEWVEIEYDGNIAFIAKQFISNVECNYEDFSVPEHRDFKSYMDYRTITNTSSIQYYIQSNYAYTGEYGIRQVNDRFCVAIGSYFGVEIGQYFDLILENGVVIPCVMGDAKADKDTDSQNIFHASGCCSEFIVDDDALLSSILLHGNVCYACEDWNSPVVTIRVYNENIWN